MVSFEGLKGPVLKAFVDGCGAIGIGFGPRSTGVDPLAEELDLRGSEAIAFGRHLLIGFGGEDPGEEGALIALAWEDDGSVFAAFEGEGPEVEAEAGLLFFVPVTLDAVFLEEGADVGIEEGGVEIGEGAGGGVEEQGEEEEREGRGESAEGRGSHGGGIKKRG